MTYVITAGCADIMDRACMEQCPVDAIVPGQRMAYINPADCIDCGACVPACPQNAVFAARLVPAELADYTAVNAEFFDGDGSTDHPRLAELVDRGL
ncbi:indolepyruvate ferredoxin oxidoreductase subunit alpha [Streptomyces sp. NBC_01803]|uniref:indolepyruvate ferredoxin oxidoreductase subunit alpha n=1 Tax=Streptomyces sp. NBC_01803 TaxID=2975946 RepID=UPI002DDB70B8|nr:4Fe-4S binding protein [Streptomyces sp. NBC_01803]WSA42953.1 4Fe-4S binding protein [Streptomyces sp. NBC_01803]